MLKNVSELWIGGNPDGNFKHKDKEIAKFNRSAKIQKNYPEIDAKLRKFCEIKGLSERKACAFATLMMIECGIRIGNEESAEGYVSKAKKTEGQVLKTYGLTTLLREHVSFPPDGSIILNFIGKKSVEHDITITDPFLVSVGKEFWSVPLNIRMFDARWLTLPNGQIIEDKNVNNFIRKSIGAKFSAKDFRTFKANIEAAKISKDILQKRLKLNKKEVNEEIKIIVSDVSKILGNSPTIARKAYINPQILRRHWNYRDFNVNVIKKKGKVKEIITNV